VTASPADPVVTHPPVHVIIGREGEERA
jgi:hypothetical protein